jgi:lysophospholipase L1-like esterase
MRSLAPDDSLLTPSDYQGIAERSNERLRFVRSIVDGQGYEHCSPGSRVTFATNSRTVAFAVEYNGRVIRRDSRNFTGAVLVDGALGRTFTNLSGPESSHRLDVKMTFLSQRPRRLELVWPYGDGMDLIAVQVEEDSTVIQWSRSQKKLAVAGDSIAQGFRSTHICRSWPFMLGQLVDSEVINIGYGSRRATASDALAAAKVGSDWLTYLIGFNDYNNQTPFDQFAVQIAGYVRTFREIRPTTPFFLITPLFASARPRVTGSIPLQAYRVAVGTVAAEMSSDRNLHLVDGLSLMPNDASTLKRDGVHPNDKGAAEISMRLAAAIVKADWRAAEALYFGQDQVQTSPRPPRMKSNGPETYGR